MLIIIIIFIITIFIIITFIIIVLTKNELEPFEVE